ncbi:MAG: hypothetical protein WC764_00120 [Candidatus Paceibacterota bacterium]
MRWTCIIEFNRHDDGSIKHRIIGLEMDLESAVQAEISRYLGSVKEPLRSGAKRGHVRIKGGDEDVDSASVKVDVIIALIELVRAVVAKERTRVRLMMPAA